MPAETEVDQQLRPPLFSRRQLWAAEQPISFLMQQAVENPDVISLAAGLVDLQTLPVRETRTAVDMLLQDDDRARAALQYGTTPGAEKLRRVLLGHLACLEGCVPEELGIDVENLIVTTGSQQLLSLIGEVLLDPEDICLVAAPTYFVFLGTLAGLGVRSVTVATDEHGMRPEALEAKLQELEAAGLLGRVKLIYLVSYYENPSGTSLAIDRRREIVEIARHWSRRQRIFVLEDAAYRELHFDGPVLPSVWSFDAQHDTVILAQTFSKSFAPGIRVGFGVLPEELRGPITDRKGNEDFGSANFNQHLIATVIERGLYDRHVTELAESYAAKRDAMLAAADEYFSSIPGVDWIRPHGGLYVWMTVPDYVETGFDSPLFRRAAEVERVMYVPGELFYADPSAVRPRHQMRLSFGVQSLEGIRTGMQRLANALNAVL